MSYKQKVEAAVAQFKKLAASSEEGYISLKPKSTSHFFRARKKTKKLDLLAFTDVVKVSEDKLFADVEGLTSFRKLTDETLKKSLIPQVVPELRSITVGGTISGLGLEASSYKYGLVHNTAREHEVLVGKGEVVNCSPKLNADLFHALPNSLGTLGYVTKTRIRLRQAKPFVKLNLIRFENVHEFIQALHTICVKQQGDFVDAVIFSPVNIVIILGEMIEKLPANESTQDFKLGIYWKYLEDKTNSHAYLTIQDYLWRWDTDVFWCLKDLGRLTGVLENKLFRKLFGSYILRSDTLNMLRRYKERLLAPQKSSIENILQDLCVNINKFTTFFDWYMDKVGVFPVWICPYKNIHPERYPLNNFKGEFLLDVGIYSGAKRPLGVEKNYYNRLLEAAAIKLKGHKGLYSKSFYSPRTFWKLYDRPKYEIAKAKYDPDNNLPGLFEKAVGERTL